MSRATPPEKAGSGSATMPEGWWPIDPDDPADWVHRIIEAGDHTVAVISHPADTENQRRAVCVDCASWMYDGHRPLALSTIPCPPQRGASQ